MEGTKGDLWLARVRATTTFVYVAALCLAVAVLVIPCSRHAGEAGHSRLMAEALEHRIQVHLDELLVARGMTPVSRSDCRIGKHRTRRVHPHRLPDLNRERVGTSVLPGGRFGAVIHPPQPGAFLPFEEPGEPVARLAPTVGRAHGCGGERGDDRELAGDDVDIDAFPSNEKVKSSATGA